MALFKQNPKPGNAQAMPDSGFKTKAIVVVVIAAVIGIGLQLMPSGDEAQGDSVEVSNMTDPVPAQLPAIDEIGPSYDSLATTPPVDVFAQDDTAPEPAPPPSNDRDPAVARLALHPDCHRYRSVLNETYRDPSPWAVARRRVATDILTDIGCFDATGNAPRLLVQHPDHRLLISGRATGDQYLSIVSRAASETCKSWANVLAQMASSPTANPEDIAEYFSRPKTAKCPSSTKVGYRGFGAARWDTTSPPVSQYPELAVAAIRLVRANPHCVQFVHEISEKAETQDPQSLAQSISETLQAAHVDGCLYP